MHQLFDHISHEPWTLAETDDMITSPNGNIIAHVPDTNPNQYGDIVLLYYAKEMFSLLCFINNHLDYSSETEDMEIDFIFWAAANIIHKAQVLFEQITSHLEDNTNA